ncbi:NAD(P)-dependent oxidoreductase [Rhizobium sp. SSA_523]|uniref:NAD(P)-dependent oxidoreductase n=1 Tax=Rhizobium sp. SSA_523 TaxID=2952477 RepID=UPI0020900839|nr:NAD(P)-dependent oxidoreductase [Rhizobium sp. SSA_523]MCO5731187.1 hydroxyacid dehydrogenase [Rhizobium sp. SSA_523]WKC22270.1 NAD(P)-dependent oxidoreductase [Rhizobium sp. SSA_523]
MTDQPCDCLIIQPIADVAVARLIEAGLRVHVARDTAFETLRPHLAFARAVITRNHGLSGREIEAAPHLSVVGVHGTGTEKVDKPLLAQREIALVNTPGANAQSVAELTIALMLGCARRLIAADGAARRGNDRFRQEHRTVELSARRLGLLGYGNISGRVAQIAQAIGMEVAVFSRFADKDRLEQAGLTVMPDIDALCRWSDILSLHGIPDTLPVIDCHRLALLGPDGFLINTARGALVDEAALADALSAGVIAGAALDVLAVEPVVRDHPLLSCPNLILTPHIGGSTQEALERTGLLVADKVLAQLQRTGALRKD